MTDFDSFITPDYCYSCAYFQITKGHFGFCKESLHLDKKKYDGTKKGSGCLAWRMRTDLIPLLQSLKEKSENEQYLPLKKIRKITGEYNQRKKKQLSHKNIIMQKDTKFQNVNVVGERYSLYNLPFAITSSHTQHHGLYRYATSHRIIEHALVLLDKGLSCRKAAIETSKFFGRDVHHGLIWKWGVKFLQNEMQSRRQNVALVKAGQFFRLVDKELKFLRFDRSKFTSIAPKTPLFVVCPKCSSTDCIGDGIRKNKRTDPKRLYLCKSCKFRFSEIVAYKNSKVPIAIVDYMIKMQSQGISANKISQNVEKEFGFKINRTSVIRIVKKFRPDAKFPQQRPRDDATRLKIRNSIRAFHERKRENGMCVVECKVM